MLFPHETIRQGQDKLIEAISKALTEKKNLLIHAPVGLGKTAGALAPTLTYILENNKKQVIIYVTPRHTQHHIAIETIKQIKNKYNKSIHVIDLVGKKNMCLQSGIHELSSSEFSEYCKHLTKNGNCMYYKNLKEKNKNTLATQIAIQDTKDTIMHVDELKVLAKKHKVCPYEIALLAAQDAHVIIADYHHVLNPSIREHLLGKINKKIEDCIIIIDEGHNIPQKLRELMSTQLSTITLNYAIKEADEHQFTEIANDIRTLKTIFENYSKQIPFEKNEAYIKKEDFINKIEEIGTPASIAKALYEVSNEVKETKKRSATESVANFILAWQGPDEGYIRLITKGFTKKGNSHVTISYKGLDPAILFTPLAEETYTMIIMSGTLTPLKMYQDVLGIDAATYELESPFPEENKLTIIIPDTTTKYTARTAATYQKITEYCITITKEIPGNAILFFPSYDVLNEIKTLFERKSTKTVFTEVRNLTKEEKTELIEQFKSFKKQGAVLLAVSSGNFGEGIDLPGGLLKGVVVVGLPLGKPDLETEALIAYYDKRFKKGWEYGYTTPAMIKTLQNAGRCIRSETDKGIIVFLDARYIWQNYFSCFPKQKSMVITKLPQEKIVNFFKNDARKIN